MNATLFEDLTAEMNSTMENIMKNLSLTDVVAANNISITLDNESKKFLKDCSSIRLAINVFAQGLNALKYLVDNYKSIGFTKMDSVMKLAGYQYFSSTQYDKRYSNSPYVMF